MARLPYSATHVRLERLEMSQARLATSNWFRVLG